MIPRVDECADALLVGTRTVGTCRSRQKDDNLGHLQSFKTGSTHLQYDATTLARRTLCLNKVFQLLFVFQQEFPFS